MRREKLFNDHKGTICKNPKTSINWSLGFYNKAKKNCTIRWQQDVLAETSETWKNTISKENENFKGRKVIKLIIENDNFS